MKNYTLTIGLEIHTELKTKTKMFCACHNDPDEKEPNVNICPVCTAQPGTLPVINKEAVKSVLKVGVALGSNLADFTEFDRKNYFYPDIPKAYQISQYKYPLVSGGSLRGVEITRVHLEEDTASSQHEDAGHSLVNFNRAGVPLMELVTAPVIHSAKEAGDFARELQLLLSPLYLNVSEANMEKGEMRVEANISISADPNTLGTKVEVKNLNSFRTMEKAIDYEYKRQVNLLEEGKVVEQETLGWDENKQATFSQRKKESSHDYRYFPDPDLPKLYISEIPEFQNLKATLPELPAERRARYEYDYGIKSEDVEVFLTNIKYAEVFEGTVAKVGKDKAQLVANYLTSDLAGLQKNGATLVPTVEAMIELVELISAGEISSRGAKDILVVLATDGGSPRAIAEAKGLFQKSDEGEILKIVEQVIAENETVVADYKAGNEKSLQFLVGQGMKLSKGSANPGVLLKMLKEKLR
ncbi:MAG: Asp-tRNA(Asn)/Glu-tRNA(Gln) amidotransferase subunit GatB [Patescibacteria group bacterium]